MHSEAPAPTNRYNANFRNRFCSCVEEYDPHQEKGTMFQCLGLGTVEDGGCGEDWFHPECVTGLSRKDWEKRLEERANSKKAGVANQDKTDTQTATKENGAGKVQEDNQHSSNPNTTNQEQEENEDEDADDTPLPPGFPKEDEFEAFFCHKCLDAFPWIKSYAGQNGFLPPVFYKPDVESDGGGAAHGMPSSVTEPDGVKDGAVAQLPSRKRKADNEVETEAQSEAQESAPSSTKRQKSEDLADTISSLAKEAPAATEQPPAICRRQQLPRPPSSKFSLFLRSDFRDHLCRCATCFPLLKPHPQLLEEEEIYEPPISEDGEGRDGAASAGTASLLDRGEAAFSNMDRVRAIGESTELLHTLQSVAAKKSFC